MDTINPLLLKKGSGDYQLTAEQKQCVEMALQGKDLKIKAFAGSGKTSTLVEIAKELNVMFIETSALAAENVSLAFEELLNSISDIKQ